MRKSLKKSVVLKVWFVNIHASESLGLITDPEFKITGLGPRNLHFNPFFRWLLCTCWRITEEGNVESRIYWDLMCTRHWQQEALPSWEHRRVNERHEMTTKGERRRAWVTAGGSVPEGFTGDVTLELSGKMCSPGAQRVLLTEVRRDSWAACDFPPRRRQQRCPRAGTVRDQKPHPYCEASICKRRGTH